MQLKVSKTFKINRSLNNKWTTFGSPIELTASAEYGSGLILYAATGYTAKEAVAQGWEEVSVLYGKRVDLTAGSPYLLAADAALTRVTFKPNSLRRADRDTGYGYGRFRRCPRERRVPLPGRTRISPTLRSVVSTCSMPRVPASTFRRRIMC